MNETILGKIEKAGVAAVLEIERKEDIKDVIDALIDGNVSMIELALRTEAAMDAISIIKEYDPDMLVGAGTVIFPWQVKEAKERGADFALSPGTNEMVLDEAAKYNLPFIPGIATPSDIEKCINRDLNVLKLFPAEPLGGIDYFKSMANPYRYLNIKFFPLGGINRENLSKWAKLDEVIAIGGTWICKKDLIKDRRFKEIEENAKEALSIWNEAKGSK